MPLLKAKLDEKSVEIRGDEQVQESVSGIVPAVESDWGKEYLDYILSVKTVSSIDEAIAHINRYNTGHSEAIITRDYANAQKILEEVDAAAVYVNASTRFTDGLNLALGLEIGIEYTETPCKRTDGAYGTDDHEVYCLWKRSGALKDNGNR